MLFKFLKLLTLPSPSKAIDDDDYGDNDGNDVMIIPKTDNMLTLVMLVVVVSSTFIIRSL